MLNVGSFKPLSELCYIISSGGTPSRKMPHYFDKNGHLWVKSKELLFKGIDDTEEKISDEGLKKSSAKYYPSGTILVAMYGANVGQLAWLKKPATVNQAICALVVDEQKADNMFVYYSLLHTREKLIIQAQGAAQQNLNAGQIKSFEIPYIDLENQQKVASILSAYDDLIENNNRRIAILEEMARSLYREWFVKFRFPGHEEVKMIDSELGQIPEGWRVVRLFDIASPTYGFAFKSKLFNDTGEGTPLVRIRDIPKDFSNTFTPEHPKKQDQILKNGDLLIGMDGDFHMGKWAGGHAYLNQRVVKISPNEGYSPYFVFLIMQKPIKELNTSIVGTTVAHLGDSHLKEINVIVPTETILSKVNQILDSIFKQEINLKVRNQNLKTQRDMLLPKLISGKISVI